MLWDTLQRGPHSRELQEASKQWLVKKWDLSLNPANNRMNELRSISFPGQPSDETTAWADIFIATWWDAETEDPAKLWPGFPLNCGIRNVYYFILLSFGVICYMAVDNWHTYVFFIAIPDTGFWHTFRISRLRKSLISNAVIRWVNSQYLWCCSRQSHKQCLFDNVEVCLCHLVCIGSWKLGTGEKWVPDYCPYFQIESYSLKNCVGRWADREYTMLIWLTGFALWQRKIIVLDWKDSSHILSAGWW